MKKMLPFFKNSSHLPSNRWFCPLTWEKFWHLALKERNWAALNTRNHTSFPFVKRNDCARCYFHLQHMAATHLEFIVGEKFLAKSIKFQWGIVCLSGPLCYSFLLFCSLIWHGMKRSAYFTHYGSECIHIHLTHTRNITWDNVRGGRQMASLTQSRFQLPCRKCTKLKTGHCLLLECPF